MHAETSAVFVSWRLSAVNGTAKRSAAAMCSFIASTLALLFNLPYINRYLKHRGPDYTGSAVAGGFQFVHNLLHMTGTLTKQPFLSADNSTVALFNGEIYNYRTLERELRPHGPPYRSDGECILEAYTKWGKAFSTRFEGEFAIAVFDLRRRRILLTTDPFGIKPLFVAEGHRDANLDGSGAVPLSVTSASGVGGVEFDYFGVSSYRSGLLRAGHAPSSIRQLGANELVVYKFDHQHQRGSSGSSSSSITTTSSSSSSLNSGPPVRFSLRHRHPLVKWDVRQHKTAVDDWERAFEEAVRVRTEGAFRGVFLALSSGYDSGAIHLAMLRLGVPHATYSIVGAENKDDLSVLKKRIAFAEAAVGRPVVAVTGAVPAAAAAGGAGGTGGGAGAGTQRTPPTSLGSFIVRVNSSAFKATHSALQRRCEPYTYSVPIFSKPTLSSPAFVPGTKLSTEAMPMLKDSAAMGVGHICSLAVAQGQRVMLTGSGADEVMTDYGFNGQRFAPHSQFGGMYPNDTALQTIFPWEDFYGGSQRNYLAKDEYVTGAFGVEGRFPFLDQRLVQEQLYLSPTLKNTYYKAGAQLYMKKYGYPVEPCVASSEHPFGEGSGCKKVGFLVPNRPRKVGATSGCVGPACRPHFRR